MKKDRKLPVTLIDLEKEYDSVNRRTLWRVLEISGKGGRLLRVVENMY